MTRTACWLAAVFAQCALCNGCFTRPFLAREFRERSGVDAASRRHATMPSMQDHELYRRILGIEAPWFVDSVDLKLEGGEIHVYLRHHEMISWPCPECGADCKLYDHQPERR